MGDMVRTLAIFAVAVLAIVAFLPKTHHGAVATPVSYSVSLAALRSQAPFPVYAPVTAPPGWTPNHITVHTPTSADPHASLDLGFYITRGGQYAAVEQSDAAGFLTAQLGRTPVQGPATTVDGTVWQSWTDSKGHPALVRTVATSTLVLDGQASAQTLRTLAASLSLRPATD
jgi:hypothetical protein